MGQSPNAGGERKTHVVRGLAVSIVLGPVVLVGALLVLGAALSMILSGLDPRAWFSTNAGDWLFGAGVAGDGMNYIRAMVGGLLAVGGSTGIRWGFYGSDR